MVAYNICNSNMPVKVFTEHKCLRLLSIRARHRAGQNSSDTIEDESIWLLASPVRKRIAAILEDKNGLRYNLIFLRDKFHVIT